MTTKTVYTAVGLKKAKVVKTDVIIVKKPFASLIKKQYPTSQEQAIEIMSRMMAMANIVLNPLNTFSYYLASEDSNSITLVRVKA